MVEKIIIIMIVFIVLIGALSASIGSGAILKIFESGDKISETQNVATDIKQEILTYIDRQNNTTHRIISNQGAVLGNLSDQGARQDKILEILLNDSEVKIEILNDINHTETHVEEAIRQNAAIIDQISSLSDQNINISKQVLNVSKEHKKVQADHDEISDEVRNITGNVDKNLYKYGENSVIKLDSIIDKIETVNSDVKNTTKEISNLVNKIDNRTTGSQSYVMDTNKLVKELYVKLGNISKSLDSLEQSLVVK